MVPVHWHNLLKFLSFPVSLVYSSTSASKHPLPIKIFSFSSELQLLVVLQTWLHLNNGFQQWNLSFIFSKYPLKFGSEMCIMSTKCLLTFIHYIKLFIQSSKWINWFTNPLLPHQILVEQSLYSQHLLDTVVEIQMTESCSQVLRSESVLRCSDQKGDSNM